MKKTVDIRIVEEGENWELIRGLTEEQASLVKSVLNRHEISFEIRNIER